MGDGMSETGETPRPVAAVEGDEIVIRVPLAALIVSVEAVTEDSSVLTDAAAFAAHLTARLNCEECGSTAIEDLLDDRVSAALDSGEPVPGIAPYEDEPESGSDAEPESGPADGPVPATAEG